MTFLNKIDINIAKNPQIISKLRVSIKLSFLSKNKAWTIEEGNKLIWCPHTDSNREPIDYKSVKSQFISFYYVGFLTIIETLLKKYFSKQYTNNTNFFMYNGFLWGLIFKIEDT